jgi:membrane protein
MGVIKRAQAFWKKFGNDWGMNLAGLLAYNFLTAIFPLLLGILALAALVAPASVIQQLAGKMNTVIPASLTSGANINFYTILEGFRKASGITAIISLVGLIWTGSNLFGVMENCFSIIFRTKTRGFIQQKVMSIIMIIIFAILAPLAVVASSISGSVSALTHALGDVPGLGLVFGIGGYAVGVLIAFILFFCIYLVVPNMAVNPRDVWRGALFAAVLFEIVNLVFPLYIRTQHSQFGAFALLLALLTFWFWVISLVLLLGAEMNSFAALGQRAAGGDLPTMLHDVQVHGAVPREGEDADAPPAGHPVSRQGERIHARDRHAGAPTGEGAAHVPGDPDQGDETGGPTRAAIRTRSNSSRIGQQLLVLLAGLLTVLSAVRRSGAARDL